MELRQECHGDSNLRKEDMVFPGNAGVGIVGAEVKGFFDEYFMPKRPN
jgi:hypothetical protein